MRQQRDFSTTVHLEDYTNKFITEAPITRERSRQRQESLTAEELSMLRGVLGTAKGSANVSSVCCRCKFAGECCPWCKIFWTPTSWSETCLAVLHSLFTFTLSMRPRGSSWFLLRRPMRASVPDQMVLAKEKLSRRRRQRDGVAISFKLPRKIAGSNDGETRALVFVDESLWLARLAGSENARCFDAALAFGRNGPTNGRSAHYRFSRSLRCLDEKRITTASIAKLSHR